LAAGDARAEYAGDPGSVPAGVELPRNRRRGTLSLAPDGALGGDGGRGRGMRIVVADTGQRISLLPVLAGQDESPGISVDVVLVDGTSAGDRGRDQYHHRSVRSVPGRRCPRCEQT